MDNLCLMQDYFAAYLRNVRQNKEKTITNYFDALKWISRHLQEQGLIQTNIFEVADLSTLYSLRDSVFNDPVFKELDARGNQMYSSGLNNYVRFAEGVDFSKRKDKLVLLDRPMPIADTQNNDHDTWKRSAIIRDQVLVAADYKCEIDPSHKTFISSKTHHLYAEGHHIIALNKQGSIPRSLDIYANIICLCPLCHRFLHFGTIQDKQPVVKMLYDQRANRLAQSGIRLSQGEFEHLVL